MKHKTAELEGALLNEAVAKALGQPERGWAGFADYWDIGGPIIERERIALIFAGEGEGWSADFEIEWSMLGIEHRHLGPTPLIAAMRAYVASKLGEEVDL